jgi:hypothetical protein
MPTLITGLPEHALLDAIPLAAGVSRREFAWLATDLSDVRMPSRLRGSDDILPMTHGVSPNPRYATASRRLIPIVFAGDCDSDGTAPAGTNVEQLWLNFDEFIGLVMDPPVALTRTLTVVHGSLEWEGEIVIEDFDYKERGTEEIVGVLDLSISAGRLQMAVGS